MCSPSNGALSIQYSLLEAAFCTSVCKGTFDETIVICCKNYFLFSQYYLVSTESIFSNYVISLFVLFSFSVLFCFYLLIIYCFLFFHFFQSLFRNSNVMTATLVLIFFLLSYWLTFQFYYANIVFIYVLVIIRNNLIRYEYKVINRRKYLSFYLH